MALLLDLQADRLSLSDGDPVSLWADESGNGYDFTQSTGSAKPTYRAGSGTPYLEFPAGGGVWLNGQNWSAFDNLDSFTVVTIHRFTYEESHFYQLVISKFDSINGTGWDVEADYFLAIWKDYSEQQVYQTFVGSPFDYNALHVVSHEKNSNTDLKLYVDSAGPLGEYGDFGSVSSFATEEPVIIGNSYIDPLYVATKVYAIQFYYPALNATARTVAEAELGGRYGVSGYSPINRSVSVSPNNTLHRARGVRIYP